MEEEAQAQAAEPEEAAKAEGGQREQPATDWRAEAKKWERRARENKRELDAARSEPKADRTVEQRLAALEEENATLRARAERSALVQSVANATGLDAALVSALNGADEDELTSQAQAIAALARPAKGAPVAPEAGRRDRPGKPSKRDILAIKDPKERKAAIAANIDLF